MSGTVVVPVTLSASFGHGHRHTAGRHPASSDALHALHYPSTSAGTSSGDGHSTLRALAGGRVQLEQELHDGSVARYTGEMRAAPEHECVLLYDEATKSYVLHHLATVTRLAGHGSAVTGSTAKPTTPSNAHALSPPVTTKNAALDKAKAAHDLSPSPRPVPSLSLPYTHGLGISAPSSSPPPASAPLALPTGRPALGRKGLPQQQQQHQKAHQQSSQVGSSRASFTSGDVEEFDLGNDLASASDSEDDVDEGDFYQVGEDGPASASTSMPAASGAASGLPRPTAASSAAQSAPPPNTTGPTNNQGLVYANTSIVLSDDEDDDMASASSDSDTGSEADFDALANDLESSLAAHIQTATTPLHHNHQQQQQPSYQQPPAAPSQRATTGSKKIKSAAYVDSDIASSSESDSDSD